MYHWTGADWRCHTGLICHSAKCCSLPSITIWQAVLNFQTCQRKYNLRSCMAWRFNVHSHQLFFAALSLTLIHHFAKNFLAKSHAHGVFKNCILCTSVVWVVKNYPVFIHLQHYSLCKIFIWISNASVCITVLGLAAHWADPHIPGAVDHRFTTADNWSA